MLRNAFLAVSLLAIGAVPAAVNAAPCKDSKGKFIKCADKPRAAVKCKTANGKFAKCGTPGAKPV